MLMPATACKSGAEKTGLFFLLLFVLAGRTNADFAQSGVYIIAFVNVSVVNVTGVSLTPSTLYVGGSTDVAVTIYNNGTVQNNATVQVNVFSAGGALADSFNYSPVVISPGTTVVLVKTWSAGSLAVGAYCANATAFYDGGQNRSNTFEECFTIIGLPVVLPPTSGGGGVGSPEGPPTPSRLPQEIKPSYKDIRFLRSTVLKEVVAGTSAFESFTVKNDADEERTVRVLITGGAQSWISYQPTETVLKPKEERVINFALAVPTYAMAGDYLVKIEVGEKEFSTEFMIVRVKSYPRNYPYPVLLRSVRLDRLAHETTVALNIHNLGTKPIPVIVVKEELPEGIEVEKDGIEFLDKPGSVTSTRPVQIEWKFTELQPNEIGYATYSLPVVLEEYSEYVYWVNTQTSVPQKESTLLELIEIKQIFVPDLFEGEPGEVTADLFYAGLQPADVSASLEAPLDFAVEPQTAFGTLAPRGVTRIKFSVTPPQGSAGTHLVNLRIVSSEGILSKSSSVHVRKREALGAAAVLSVLPMQVILMLAAAVIIATALYLSEKARKRREEEKTRYRAGRETYLDQIKELMK